MFGLSFTHLLILAVIAIVFIGPEQLPEVARTIARLLNEWKRASSEIQSSLTNTLREDFNPNSPLKPPPEPSVEHHDAKVMPLEPVSSLEHSQPLETAKPADAAHAGQPIALDANVTPPEPEKKS